MVKGNSLITTSYSKGLHADTLETVVSDPALSNSIRLSHVITAPWKWKSDHQHVQLEELVDETNPKHKPLVLKKHSPLLYTELHGTPALRTSNSTRSTPAVSAMSETKPSQISSRRPDTWSTTWMSENRHGIHYQMLWTPGCVLPVVSSKMEFYSESRSLLVLVTVSLWSSSQFHLWCSLSASSLVPVPLLLHICPSYLYHRHTSLALCSFFFMTFLSTSHYLLF